MIELLWFFAQVAFWIVGAYFLINALPWAPEKIDQFFNGDE